MLDVLVTCPPMLGMLDSFSQRAEELGFRLHSVSVAQTLSESILVEIVPNHDAWIIGDDPATERVLRAGIGGRLRAAVKWGVGLDNVDVEACQAIGLPFDYTPGVFGEEVADLAMGYLLCFAKNICSIDRQIRSFYVWPKPVGMSLDRKMVGVVGLGNIGLALLKRLRVFGLNVIAYDPFVDQESSLQGAKLATWPERLEELDFLILTCSLNSSNFEMLNEAALSTLKASCVVINVSRGGLIDESALIYALEAGKIGGAALDVFREEPLPQRSALRDYDNTILGSHNASNTKEGVIRASTLALNKLSALLVREGR